MTEFNMGIFGHFSVLIWATFSGFYFPGMSILWVGSASMGFSKSLMPEKSLQVTRLRLVTWKDFSGIRDLEKPILALPPHWIGLFL